MFTIVISEKGGAERRETFERSEISVGRVQGNDLMLPEGQRLEAPRAPPPSRRPVHRHRPARARTGRTSTGARFRRPRSFAKATRFTSATSSCGSSRARARAMCRAISPPVSGGAAQHEQQRLDACGGAVAGGNPRRKASRRRRRRSGPRRPTSTTSAISRSNEIPTARARPSCAAAPCPRCLDLHAFRRPSTRDPVRSRRRASDRASASGLRPRRWRAPAP